MMNKEVMILTGAGQIGMAIARRMGYGMKIVVGDKRKENAEAVADILNKAGFEAVPREMDLSSRASILTAACLRLLLPRSCCRSMYCNHRTYAIRCMPTSWPNVAM